MLGKHQHQYNAPTLHSASGKTAGDKGVRQTDNRGLENPIQRKANNTGLPDNLKSGIENLSGHSMNDVRVHFNSTQPAQLNAHAFAQGNQIHVASGQEKHLPHEAWHVVQQKQGRVRPTMQMKGKLNINDDSSLEREADVMGVKALQLSANQNSNMPVQRTISSVVLQRAKWPWWVGATAKVVGEVGGAAVGAVRGGANAIWNREDITSGAQKGLLEGAQEGVLHPVKGVGAVLGGIGGAIAGATIGAVTATASGIAAGVTGAAAAYNETGSLLTAGAAGLTGGIATGAIGYASTIASGAAAGAAIGSATASVISNAVSPYRTRIRHEADYITLPGIGTRHPVGKKMEAQLAPADPVVGSATGANWTWMQFLRGKYPNANVVRGHLLNHDLGGFGMPSNLYPISTAANQEHSDKVEQKVKGLLSIEIGKGAAGVPVNYSVRVQDANHNPQVASFLCTYYTQGKTAKNERIDSDLGNDAGGFGGGLKINPLEHSIWYHNDRSGFETGPEENSLRYHRHTGNILIHNSKSPNIEANVNAHYQKNAGERKKVVAENFETLDYLYFRNWDATLKNKILEKLQIANGYFGTQFTDYVKSTPSFQDAKGNPLDIYNLTGKILRTTLLSLEAEYKANSLYPLWEKAADESAQIEIKKA